MVEPTGDPTGGRPPIDPPEHEIITNSVDSDDLFYTFFFWVLFVAVIFTVGRYSDQIGACFKRILGLAQDDEEQQMQKLSGGVENSSIQDSLGQKIKEIASVSKETLKKTLSKGKDAITGAASTMTSAAAEKRQRGKRKKKDGGDGELMLLNADEDDISRLDGDEERPFQSFAAQIQSFSGGGSQSEYTQLGSEKSVQDTQIQLEQMKEDLAKIQSKEQALDAENKILRAQLFTKSDNRKSAPTKSASDYQTLPGEFKATKAKIDPGYSKLAGENTMSSPGKQLDEEPVKLSATQLQAAPTETKEDSPGKAAVNPYKSYDQQAMEEIEGLLLDEL